ncbi:hypothetical protein [Streptomyces sp. NPDC012466]|uniref:hypothetical protein n=1 Tax=Streptomyces sp. NPDC012466 TaxID=3364835 RepID=UPI0036E69B8A
MSEEVGQGQSSRDDILKVYESERRDEQNTAALIIAVTVGTLAYFAAATGYLADRDKFNRVNPYILLAAPFPLLILTGYVTFQYAASRVRQSYLMHLEQELSTSDWSSQVNVPGFMGLHQGIFFGWKTRLWPFAALTVLTLISHVILVLGFTIVSLVAAYQRGASHFPFSLVALFYFITVAVNVLAAGMMLRFPMDSRADQLTILRFIACRTMKDEAARWEKSAIPDRLSNNYDSDTLKAILAEKKVTENQASSGCQQGGPPT